MLYYINYIIYKKVNTTDILEKKLGNRAFNFPTLYAKYFLHASTLTSLTRLGGGLSAGAGRDFAFPSSRSPRLPDPSSQSPRTFNFSATARKSFKFS